MTSYTQGKVCTWLVKAESNSIIKATVTSVDLPFSSQNDCYHWLEFRDYLIGDEGKELCGQSTTTKTYTQANIGKVSPFMIRFNSQKTQTPGTGFTVKVEAMQSGCMSSPLYYFSVFTGCMSSPCKTGSLCTEGSGDGSYTCSCQNGLSGKTATSSERLCDRPDCGGGVLTRGTGYQFLTLTPYYDGVPWNHGSKAAIKTSAQFIAVDRCLSFDYSLGNNVQGSSLTEINVYVEGTGKTKTNVKNLKTTTDYTWKTETVSISAVDNLVIYIEGVMGPQLIGIDNISLRPGLCTNTPCNPNPCINGGTCDGSSPPSGSKYVCTCPTGFSGDRCENAINPCDGSGCQNDATCVADQTSTEGYRCQCKTGYTGLRCESLINPCDGNGCQNDATCVADQTSTEGYSCQCKTGYTGLKCESLINPCDGHGCQNDATCVADQTSTEGYRCQCKTGYTGLKCESLINPCNGNGCQNDATCVADQTSPGGYWCQCKTGYTGLRCESLINPCNGNGCQNDATCVADQTSPGGYWCQCKTGYTGLRCESLINPCNGNGCQNDATCVADQTSPGGYWCQCKTGYTGLRCESLINPCNGNGCQNDATCVADQTSPGGYWCQCKTGYTGLRCESLVNPCDGHGCQNDATCVADQTSTEGYRCQCKTGYTGLRCESLINPCDGHGCQNDATCVADQTSTDGYRCQCKTGYTGLRCETPINNDACLSNPCQHDGSCTNTPGEENPYRCECKPGFLGQNCEGFSCGFERRRERSCFLRTRTRGWFRRNRRTPSRGTGPNSAYKGKYFFYFEASRYQAATIISNVRFQNAPHCLSLQYHMWGSNMGSFVVYTYSAVRGLKEEFTIAGDQGNQWNNLELDLTLDDSTWVILQAKKGTSYKSDVAIDDVRLMPNSCP
nr:fibropellin-1 [Crassostrea gigas]